MSESEHRPFVLGLIGAMLVMNGAMVADDRTVQEQKITALLIAPIASISLMLGVFAAEWHAVVLIALLVFTFIGIYVRQFGSRWTTLGGMAYTAFFSSVFFRVPIDQTWFVCAGIFISGFCSFIIKFWIVPDRAHSAIRWSLSAYRAGLRRFILKARNELAKNQRRNREALRPQMVRVNELALLSEDSILNASDAIPGSGALVRALQGTVFDLELAARQIFESFEVRGANEILLELKDLEGRFALHKAQAVSAEEDEEAAVSSAAHLSHSFAKVRYTALGSRFHFQTRQAIQATIATAVASVIGTMISTDRWYWAPLTAYIVFTGTTRGDSLRRAIQRFLGTAVGVAAGLGLATVLQGHRDWEMAAVFVAMFCAIFSIKSSYAWYAVWLTTLVAIFYSILGLLTPGLLYLRIEQTLLGGICGALATFLIFPVSARTSLRIELSRLFKMLSEQLTDVARGALPRRERRLRVRALERELLTLRAIAGPLHGPLGRPVREETRIVVHGAAAMVHFARHFIVFYSEAALESSKPDVVKVAAFALAERAANLSKAIESAKFVDLTVASPSNAPATSAVAEPKAHPPEAAIESLMRLAGSISAFESRFPINS